MPEIISLSRYSTTMTAAAPLVNPIDPSVIDKCDPDFVKVYNKYQGELCKPQDDLVVPRINSLPVRN